MNFVPSNTANQEKPTWRVRVLGILSSIAQKASSLGGIILRLWTPFWRTLSFGGIGMLVVGVVLGVIELGAQIQSSTQQLVVAETINNNLSIYVEYPGAVSRGSTGTLRIGVQNRSDFSFPSVKVYLVGDGSLWFSGKNYVEFNPISKGMANNQVLAFTVSPTIPDAGKITQDVQVEYSLVENGSVVSHWLDFRKKPTLTVSRLLEINEAAQKAATGVLSVAGSLITVAGFILGAIASFRGRLGEFLSLFKSILGE